MYSTCFMYVSSYVFVAYILYMNLLRKLTKLALPVFHVQSVTDAYALSVDTPPKGSNAQKHSGLLARSISNHETNAHKGAEVGFLFSL